MERNYDRKYDSKKAIKRCHTSLRILIKNATFHLDNKDFNELESVYLEISCLASSLEESARVLQRKAEKV